MLAEKSRRPDCIHDDGSDGSHQLESAGGLGRLAASHRSNGAASRAARCPDHATAHVASPISARHSATSRTYCYRIHNAPARDPFEHQRALHLRRKLDQDALNTCATALLGSRDFTAFTPTETKHVHFERNVLSAQWHRSGEILAFWIEADAFMRQMNRVLVGTMLEVATGARTLQSFTGLLDGAPRSAAGDLVLLPILASSPNQISMSPAWKPRGRAVSLRYPIARSR